MAYTKQTWNQNELVTSAKLNHMEDGIAGLSYSIEIETTDWVSASSTFTYTYTATGLTDSDDINYSITSGEEYIQSAITVTTGTNTLTFTTSIKPTGTIGLIIFTI